MDGPAVAGSRRPPSGRASEAAGGRPREPDLHPKDGLPPGLRNRLLRLAAFQNPEFYKAQAMRLPTYDKPRVIACAEDHPHHIGLPRGCLDDVRALLDDLGIRLLIRDERCAGEPLDVVFHGELRPEQLAAANALAAHDTGVLAATTAFGKTVVAAWLIAQRGVNTLVLVHRRQLLDQWVERLSTFLGLPRSRSAGSAAGSAKRPGMIDVAVIQSLVRKGVVNDCVADYGHLIVDECHHLSAHSFEQVARRAKARFVLGSFGHRHSQGRPPSDHLHAVRSGPPSRERQAPGGSATVLPLGHRSPDGLRFTARTGRRQASAVSGAVQGTGRGRASQPADLR